MHIKKVEAFPIQLPRDHARAQGGAGSPHRLREDEGSYRWSTHYPALYSTEFETCLVRVTLSDGTIGWGEAQAPLAPTVPAEIVRTLLAVAVEGESFDGSQESIRRLWWQMYSTMRVRGQTGGFMLDAIAGVDLALWDAAAKLAAQPIRQLIAGPAVRTSVPVYVSGIPGQTLEDRMRFVNKYWQAGYKVFKIYFESDWEQLLEQVDRMQGEYEAIAIAVDALWHLPAGKEIECAEELAERRVLWLECPLLPEDVEGHVRLVNESGVRLALGESYRTRFDAKAFFDREILSYWQPDLGRSGITESLELAAMAKQAGIAIVPHVSIAMPPQLTAAVEVAAALTNCPLCEFNPSVVDLANRFCVGDQFRVREGHYAGSCGKPGGMAWEELFER